MSLIITAWDKSWGVAVCEGRAIAIQNGVKVPAVEDHSKLSLLPDGSVLGITGGFREGHSRTSMCGVVTEPLRREIHAKAETQGFKDLCITIPELLAVYRAKYPELGFSASLLGTDDGVVRGAAWSSNGAMYMPTDTAKVHASVLGLTDEINQEVTDALRLHFNGTDRRYLAAQAPIALGEIIKDLAGRHVELNDRIHFETVLAPAITTDGFCLNTLEPKESGANVTSGHVLSYLATQTATATASATAVSIPGLAFSFNAASASDEYNFFGSMLGAQTAGTVGAVCQIALWVDGVSKRTSVVAYPTLNGETSTSFVMSLTGLTAGAHTVQMYFYSTGSSYTFDFYPGSTVLCQRVF